ncbi:MAG: glycosidase [Firmicutes bacterium HGW-Firmicutes-9]|jgi:sucrose phosphorylase|nr:MAG: glycosidase [Firmicutes bacterium HGW-Firmicutes-9]
MQHENPQASPLGGTMLNLYPDSLGANLSEAAAFFAKDDVRGAFSALYVLPSLFHTDLDRGFSVIDYGIEASLASQADLDAIRAGGVSLKLDFVLNHASVQSPQFQDMIARGDDSPYRDFFIDWNAFWKDRGELTPEGFVQPKAELIAEMFFRKPGLPILMVRFPDGTERPYWNTFYQEVRYPRLTADDWARILSLPQREAETLTDLLNAALEAGKKPAEIDWPVGLSEAGVNALESRRTYLGQMDLNVKEPLVWAFYEETLQKLATYGAKIVRLDAFAYASKIAGRRNFFNEPETWDMLERLRGMAAGQGLMLLPEIHATYAEQTYAEIAKRGYMTYDFFLPGLLLDALETGSGSLVRRWAEELKQNDYRVVNMLGCHDGIPLLDLRGLVPDERIESLIETVVARGGYVKNLYGQKNAYYQVNATYFSALGESERRLLFCRAVQLFMPGMPQVWYLDLFAGKNDHEAVSRAGAGGHKEINRTNLSKERIETALDMDVVQRQLALLRFRNTFPAFGFEAKLTLTQESESTLVFVWEQDGSTARLRADFVTAAFSVEGIDPQGTTIFSMTEME